MKQVKPWVIMTAWLLLAFVACDEPSEIGADLFTDAELYNILSTDTISIAGTNLVSEPLATNLSSLSVIANLAGNPSFEKVRPYLLGSLTDPLLGKTQAGIYTQLRLKDNDADLGSLPRLDSIVLSIAYDVDAEVLYGNVDALNTIYVYELIEPMTGTDNLSNEEFAINASPIGQKRDFVYTPLDSVDIKQVEPTDDSGGIEISTIRVAPQIRIKLSDELGNRFLAQSGELAFENDDRFKDFFKGIYIAADPNNEAIAAFNLFSGQSKITLYYHNEEQNGLNRTFFIDEQTEINNRFEHEYDGTPIETHLQQAADQQTDTAYYLQGLAGLDVKLEFPYLQNLGTIAVNEAYLECYQLPDAESDEFAAPLALQMTHQLLNSEQTQTNVAFGEQVEIDGQELTKYTLRLNFYTQDKLNGLHENETLSVYLPSFRAGRVAIGGPKHSLYPMKLKVLYTRLNE